MTTGKRLPKIESIIIPSNIPDTPKEKPQKKSKAPAMPDMDEDIY